MIYLVDPIQDVELAFCNGITCGDFNCGRYSVGTCTDKVDIPDVPSMP